MKEQEQLEIKLIGDSLIKVPKTLPKPIDENLIEEVLKFANHTEHLIISLLYGFCLRISELLILKITDILDEWVEVIEKKGIQMNFSQIRYLLTKVFKKSGIKASPHQVRHSFATHFLQHGATELLAHISMISPQIYTQLSSNK